MSRFDIYTSPDGSGYIIDLQSDFLNAYTTRVIAPLIPEQEFGVSATHLNPIVVIEDERHVLLTHFLSSVPVTLLKRPVSNIANQADEITRALDLLFQGY